MLPRISSAALALVVVGALAACGEETVEQADIETEVQSALSKSVGQEAPKATCPDELKAEEGATTRCYMDFPEKKRLGITVTVKSVDGDTAKFDVQADDKLTTTPG